MLQVHKAQKPYDCSHCELSFYELSAKKRHEKEHSDLKPFRCFICAFEFSRASNLRTHILKVHNHEIGKSVVISKSEVNNLKFEFNIGKIVYILIIGYSKIK